MRIEIAERMRCPASHSPTPLVVVARRTLGRDLIEGVAGCPTCYAEASISGGNVQFSAAGEGIEKDADATAGPAATAAARESSLGALDARDRLRAQLGLAEPGGAVLVTGEYASLAAALAADADVAVVSWNTAAPEAPGVSAVWVPRPVIPFSDATFRAAALGAHTPPEIVREALRAVAPGGRVVGRLPLALTEGLKELARDDKEWVAESTARPQGIVQIQTKDGGWTL